MDESGNELGSYAPEKDYQAAIISSPDIRTGNTYQVVTGEDTVEMTVSGIVTIYGTAPGGGAGRGPGGDGREMGDKADERGGFGGDRPERGKMPEPSGVEPPGAEPPAKND